MTPATKPVTRRVSARVPHGVTPLIAVTIYPNGNIGLRELRRPKSTEILLDVGQLYVSTLRSQINAREARVRSLAKRHGIRVARLTAEGIRHLIREGVLPKRTKELAID